LYLNKITGLIHYQNLIEMKKFSSKLILLAMLVLAGTACKKDEPNPPAGQPHQTAVGTLDLGSNVNADFQGRVVDESGNPVANVLISVGGESTYTNNNGLFVLKGASVPQKLAYVKAEKSGYFPGSRSVIPTTTAANFVKIQLLALNVAGTIPAGQEAVVTISGGASIEFNGYYANQAGEIYNGTVTVAAKYLPPLAAGTAEQMPGMLYAQNADDEAGALVTYGMVVVELYGSAGQSLNIAEGSFAKLHMPVDAAQASGAPASIPLWFFDEVAGYWIEDGSATLIDGEYVGVVSHFTWWNCDVFWDACELHAQVNDNSGNPLGNATLEIDAGGGLTTYGFSNTDGSYFTYLPANTTIDIDVSYGCGGTTNSYTVGPYAIGSSNNETFIAGSPGSFVTITGSLVDCDMQPVTNGEVYFMDGYSYCSAVVTNGTINMTLPYCTIGSIGTFYVYDWNQPYAYLPYMTVAITTPVTDVGLVQICDSIYAGGGPGWIDTTGCANEIIQIEIDGVLALLDSCVQFEYYDSLGTVGFVIYSWANTNYWVASADVNSIGVYPGTSLDMPYSSGEVIFADYGLIDGSSTCAFSTSIGNYGGPGGMITFDLVGSYTDQWGGSHDVVVYVAANIP
jgi:hypothetical protein